MTKSRHSSFRRILLRRLLLLSIPVLLTGEVVAYKKARSGLIETARYNLTASADRKAESLQGAIAAVRANLATATAASALQSDSPIVIGDFLKQFQRSAASFRFECVQLIELTSKTVKASTDNCPSAKPIVSLFPQKWEQPLPTVEMGNPDLVGLSPVKLPTNTSDRLEQTPAIGLVFSAPVFPSHPSAKSGQADLLHTKPSVLPRYALSVQSAFFAKPTEANESSGYTIVIDQASELILAHPLPGRIGIRIGQDPDANALKTIVKQALGKKTTESPLLAFEEETASWLVGHSVAKVTIDDRSPPHAWVVLATTPMGAALHSLGEIKQVLIILTLGLLTAILLTTLYLTRDLALPIEELSDYALRIRQRYASDRAPKNFKVRELNHLAEALDSMVERLENRAKELELAWQEAQAANEVKSEFLATTSHELRTPLNAIIGCVRLVRDDCCDDRQEELDFLRQADEAAIHLLKIINDLLDIAKIEAGKVELSLQPVSIQALCQQCLKMVTPGAEMKRLNLELSVDGEIDRVLLDERRVRQMVINLLSNAVKFTPEGGQVQLSGRLRYGHQLSKDARPDRSPITPDTTYLCLEVSDSGIGIPEDRWHLLFRPFQQIDSSLTRKHEGTGLGLSLTKGLAELHGGTLSFRSVFGKGSKFRIWLPLLEPSPEKSSDEKRLEEAVNQSPIVKQPPVSLPKG